MSQLEEIAPTLSKLCLAFDRNLRTNGMDKQQKGWGQFFEAETQADQIGLYGTCAGVAVKTAQNKDAAVDSGVELFLAASWKEPKNYNQNVRLAFLILCLSRSNNSALATIREDAVKELLRRKHPDGAWSDGLEQPAAKLPPNKISTAWALLALCQVRPNATLEDTANYLHGVILASRRIDKEVDPLLLAALLTAMEPAKIDKRVRRAAARVLRRQKPSDNPTIYFFDYRVPRGKNGTKARRDFLCVPQFFAYAALAATTPKFRPSIESFSREIGFHKIRIALSDMLEKAPLKNPRSEYPSTVDQAFLALALVLGIRMDTGFRNVVATLAPLYYAFKESYATRLLFPLIAIPLIAISAKDPKMILSIIGAFGHPAPEAITTFINSNTNGIAAFAVVVSMLAGQPLIRGLVSFVQKKWFI